MRDNEVRDSEVVASIVAGDPNGLATAYDKYADLLYTYCRSILRDPADAADAVQDTFVIAASRLDGLRDPEKLRSWLYTVARNECMRVLRASKDISALDEAPEMIDETTDVGVAAERADLRTLFRDASGGLNDNEREVIELSLRHKMEAGEIAGVLGVSNNHAHSLLSRARTQLETCLGALLVGRSGRADCNELHGLLGEWDGKLTVLLRKRLHRHIEHCSTCTSRRAFVLQPSNFLGLPPLVAIAGALRWLTVPNPLKGKVLALATGTSSAAAAHRGAVLHRAGSFNHHGFPHVLHGAKAGAAHGAGAKASAFLKTPQGQGTVAAVVLALIAASTAMALTGNTEHVALANGGHAGQGAGGGSGSGGGGGAGGGAGGGSGGGGGGGGSGSGGAGGSHGPSGSKSGHNAGKGSGGSGSQPGQNSPAGSIPGSGSGLSAPSLPGSTLPGSTPPSGPSPARPQTPVPSTSSSPATPPSPSGTVTASGATPGFLTVPGSTTITVTNSGASQAHWAMTVSGGSGTISVSPKSGSLAPGKSATVTVRALSSTAAGQTITLAPGGTTWTVLLGWNSSSSQSPIPGLPSFGVPTLLPSTPATQSVGSTPAAPAAPSTPAAPIPVPSPITATTPATAPAQQPSQPGQPQTPTAPAAPSGSTSPTCAVYAVLPTEIQAVTGNICP